MYGEQEFSPKARGCCSQPHVGMPIAVGIRDAV
jgi:hypothetical protein